MLHSFTNYCVLLLAAVSFVSISAAREFTDFRGDSVEAEISTLVGNKVTLKLKNGRSITLPLNQLSEQDQEYAKEWKLNNPTIKLDYDVKRIRKKLDDDQKSRRSYIQEKNGTKNYTEYFIVEVKNNSFDPLTDLKFEYEMVAGLLDRYANDATRLAGTSSGTAEIKELDSMKSEKFLTDAIETVRVDSWEEKTTVIVVSKYNTSLVGLKIKTYFKDKLIDTYEYGKFPNRLLKKP